MCRVDNCSPWAVYRERDLVARREHRCSECDRMIHVGERYQRVEGRVDDEWLRYATCRHCQALSEAMRVWCGGWPLGYLLAELVEHWRDGFASIALGRLIVGARRRWHDGADAVPVGVRELAERVMM